jgi:hypothetical protein
MMSFNRFVVGCYRFSHKKWILKVCHLVLSKWERKRGSFERLQKLHRF